MSACQLTKLSPQSQLNQPVSQQEQNRQQTAPRPRLDIQSQPLRPPKLEHQTTHLPLDEALYFRTSAPPSGCGKFRTGCPKSHATVARLSNRIKTLGKPESQCKKNLLTCKAAESTTTRDRGSTSSTTIKPTSRCDNLLETNRRWPQRKSQLEQLCDRGAMWSDSICRRRKRREVLRQMATRRNNMSRIQMTISALIAEGIT
mmetsp:Transcript_32811/g.79832  ORF Transcript_32811/g.79832 Transcript_32811/m.79832 type:complete len:202 (+) Transcript_32811:42-647(+)